MHDSSHAISVTRSVPLKLKLESYAWLNAAAFEVNTVPARARPGQHPQGR
jgi:hypothetical protein